MMHGRPSVACLSYRVLWKYFNIFNIWTETQRHVQMQRAQSSHEPKFPLIDRIKMLLPQIRTSRSLIFNFFLIGVLWGGVLAGSTRHVGHWMAYCTCPGWIWWWRIWWNEDWQGKPKYSEKTCPNAALSTTNPTLPDPGSRGGKPATNLLSYEAINF
jgi:hypothetical protein